MLTAEGRRTDADGWQGALYSAQAETTHAVTLKAVPYGLWCNREPGEMLVWQKVRI